MRSSVVGSGGGPSAPIRSSVVGSGGGPSAPIRSSAVLRLRFKSSTVGNTLKPQRGGDGGGGDGGCDGGIRGDGGGVTQQSSHPSSFWFPSECHVMMPLSHNTSSGPVVPQYLVSSMVKKSHTHVEESSGASTLKLTTVIGMAGTPLMVHSSLSP